MALPSDPSMDPPARTSAGQAIADAALSLFARTDPRRVTVRQIADAANVSVGSVYAQFTSKDGLYLAILDDALRLSARYTLHRKWSDSPLQRVFNVGDAYLRFATENPEAFRVIVQRVAVDTSDPQIAAADARVERRITRETRAITDDLVAAMQAGEMIELPVEDVFVYLWGSWAGVLQMMVRDDRFRISPEQARRALAGAQYALARGVRPG